MLIENGQLASLSAFDDLRTIGGDLILRDNQALQSLGLPDLETLGGIYLAIEGNTSLSTCAAEALLDRLRANGFTGTASITGNGPCP